VIDVAKPTLAQGASRDVRRVVLDLRELEFMDSTGLRLVLSAAREIPNLTLTGPLQEPVKRLLELTQTLTILPFEPS